ncbi:Ubiquitin carboxyl-terminal hydrolase 16, partial [Sesamum angolense]
NYCFLSCEWSKHIGLSTSSAGSSSKGEEAKPSSSSTYHEEKESISEGHAPSNDDAGLTSLQSLAPKLSDEIVWATGSMPFRKLLSVEKKWIHRGASCLLENSSYLRNASSETKPSARRVVDQLRSSTFTRPGSLCAGSGNMRRDETKLVIELLVKTICYANSVLQCLVFTLPLTAFFIEGIHLKACERKGWCFTCEFEKLVKKAKEGNSPLSLVSIMSQMQCIGSHMGNGREEDAHEFLRYAIDAMQSVCLKEAGVKMPSSLDEETTLMGLTFGGYLRSKIECMRCGGNSEQHERIMDLTVEIGGDIGTLEDALRQFTRSEMLDGENKYHCGRKIWKLNKAVHFPEILNLAPFMSGTSDKSPIYQLYGVLVHLDVMNATFSGHYVCDIKNNQGSWFKADDCMVQSVELKKVLLEDAYLLLYSRCSPRAPRLIRSSMVPRELKKRKTVTCKSKSHLEEPWNVSVSKLTGRTCNDGDHQYCMSRHSLEVDLEENTGSEDSSSFFSEGGDRGNSWTGRSGNSESETSSPSSSPSPLHANSSAITDLDNSLPAASSRSCFVKGTSTVSRDGFRAPASDEVQVLGDKRRDSLQCPDTHQDCRKFVDISSCRKNYSSRLGCDKSRDNLKGPAGAEIRPIKFLPAP